MFMRPLAGLLCLGILLTGCATRNASGPAEPSASGTEAGGTGPGAVEYPVVNAVLADSGTVVSVNTRLRFAVLDFGFHLLPELGASLDVFREGMKVGELRVSGPSRGSTIVADITGGEVRSGDEVRPPGVNASESSR